MGFTAGVATAHVGGTDNAPTVLASPRPAATLGAGTVPGGRLSSGAGNGCTGAGPSSGQALFPVPTADDLVRVRTGAGTDDVQGKGHDPDHAEWYVGGEGSDGLTARRERC